MNIDAQLLRTHLLGYICFLFSSAYSLEGEPRHYGVLRLLTASERMMEIMAEHGLNDPYLETLRHRFDHQREEILHNRGERQNFINQVITDLVEKSIAN